MRRFPIRAAAAVMVFSLLSAGCADGERPMCEGLAEVRHSVENLRNVNLSENGVSALGSALTQLKAEVIELAADTQSKYGPYADGVSTAMEQLSASVSTAKADPTFVNLTAVRTAFTGLREAVQQFRTAAAEAC